MKTGLDSDLLRDHRDPQQASFLELFFDVVYVFALTRISHTLAVDVRWVGAFQATVLLCAIWLIWAYTTWNINRFNPHRPAIQLMVIGIMAGSLLLSAELPEAFGRQGLAFASTYVAIQLGRSAVTAYIMRGRWVEIGSLQVAIWVCLTVVPWIVGALAHGTARLSLWTLAVVLSFLPSWTDFWVPKLGAVKIASWKIGEEHLSERYRQFLIIALGETILSSGFQFAELQFEGKRTAAFLIAFTGTALLWRIYFYHAAELMPKAFAAAPAPGIFGRSMSYAHLIMVAGIVLTSVGDEVVVTHPTGSTRPGWVAVILGGAALFLAGRSRLDHLTFSRLARSRLIGLFVLAVLAALTPVMVSLPPILVAATVNTVLLGVATSDTIAWRLHPRPPAPPLR